MTSHNIKGQENFLGLIANLAEKMYAAVRTSHGGGHGFVDISFKLNIYFRFFTYIFVYLVLKPTFIVPPKVYVNKFICRQGGGGMDEGTLKTPIP